MDAAIVLNHSDGLAAENKAGPQQLPIRPAASAGFAFFDRVNSMRKGNEHSKGIGIEIRPSQMVMPAANMDYLYRFERTLSMLEQSLHMSDDPEQIARDVLEVCRDFYNADWCGMVTADVETGIFYPVYWANRDKKVTTTLFDEIEYM